MDKESVVLHTMEYYYLAFKKEKKKSISYNNMDQPSGYYAK